MFVTSSDGTVATERYSGVEPVNIGVGKEITIREQVAGAEPIVAQ
jgi:hypothetical protein